MVWQNGCEEVCISAMGKLCGFCGIVCGLPVDFWWAVDIWLVMCIPEAQGGGVVGVVWALPAQHPVH